MTTPPRKWDDAGSFVINDTETCIATAALDDTSTKPAVCVTAAGGWRPGHSPPGDLRLVLSPQQAAVFGMQLVWAAMEAAPDIDKEQ